MSLDLKPVQARLPEEVYDALRLYADANGQDLGEALRVIATEALLGKGHMIIVAANNLARALSRDNMRQRATKAANLAEALRERAERDE